MANEVYAPEAEPQKDTDGPGSRWRNPRSAARILEVLPLSRFSGVVIWAGFLLLFTIWEPGLFWTSTTWQTIAVTYAITGMLAVSLLFPLSAGVFDLSAAQNLGLCALVVGVLMARNPHLSPLAAVGITLVVGAAVGAVNGLLIAFVGMDSFIATLGTSSVLAGIAAAIGGGSFVGPFPSSFAQVTSYQPFGIPVLLLYLLAMACIVWYVLEHTPIGRRASAIGANPDTARLAGVRTRRYIFFCLVVAGVGAAISGVLLASSLNTTSETLGPDYLIPAYAAVFLGTTQLKPGRFNVGGTLLAIYLLGTGVDGLELAGANVWVTDVFDGVALIGAVSVAIVLDRRRRRKDEAVASFADDDELLEP